MKFGDGFPLARVLCLFGALLGCGAMEDPGAAPAAAQPFLMSVCGRCVKEACSAEIARCEEDPGCTGALRCAYACPLGANGDADPACELTCPRPQSTVGRRAAQELYLCRSRGAGAACAACGRAGQGPGSKDPLLAQQCSVPPQPPETCDACELAHCCQSKMACGDECKKLLLCLQGAKNSTETFTCWKTNPSGAAPWARRYACTDTRCHRECGALPDPCVDCYSQRCADTKVACDSDPSCALLSACQSDCVGRLSGDARAACFFQCNRDYGAGLQRSLDFLLCTLQLCQPECNAPDGNL